MLNRKDVVLVGYSGHAHVVHEILMLQGYRPIAYLAPHEQAHRYLNLPYWGSEQDPHTNTRLRDHDYFVAIGDNKIRKQVSLYLFDLVKFHPVLIIAPTAYVSSDSKINPGCLVNTAAIIHPGTQVGFGTILNTACSIDHDCLIEDFVHIGPGAVLCGNVSVGEGTFIGAGTTIIPGIRIGKWATIGAGSVVIRDVPDGVRIAGNPAKSIA